MLWCSTSQSIEQSVPPHVILPDQPLNLMQRFLSVNDYRNEAENCWPSKMPG